MGLGLVFPLNLIFDSFHTLYPLLNSPPHFLGPHILTAKAIGKELYNLLMPSHGPWLNLFSGSPHRGFWGSMNRI